MWCDDDYKFVTRRTSLIVSESPTDEREVAEKRDLVLRMLLAFLNESADHECLVVLKMNDGLRVARRNLRNAIIQSRKTVNDGVQAHGNLVDIGYDRRYVKGYACLERLKLRGRDCARTAAGGREDINRVAGTDRRGMSGKRRYARVGKDASFASLHE